MSWPGELAVPEPLVEHLDELWDVLRDGPDRFVPPERIVEFAAASIPHAEHCGLSVCRANRPPQSLGSSGPLPATVDALQHTMGEGPCLDSVRDDRLTRVDDLGSDGRWPRFAERCVAETGVVSVLSVPLTLGGRDQAALNLYARRHTSSRSATRRWARSSRRSLRCRSSRPCANGILRTSRRR